MHNQHTGLSQLLATQRMTERQEQAAQARLAQRPGRTRRRHRWRARRWWQLVRRPGAATRTLATATAIAALIATLSAGQALAVPDERQLERQGWIDRQAATGQADEQDKAGTPSQAPTAPSPRRHFKPEPPMDTGPRLDADEQVPPAPAPDAPADSRDGLAAALAAVALLLAVGAGVAWRIHRRRPRPEPTT